MCIVEPSTWKILESNRAFLSWLGYTTQPQSLCSISFSDIIYKKDIKSLALRLQQSDGTLYIEEQLRLVTASGGFKEGRVIGQVVQDCYLFVFDDQQMQKERESELKSQITAEQQRTTETAKNLVGMHEILQKLQHLPHILQSLPQKQTTPYLQKIVAYLCHEDGLGYTSAAIFFIRGDHLELLASQGNYPWHRFDLRKQHPLAKLARGESPWLLQNSGEASVPIHSANGDIMGVLQVSLSTTERAFMLGNAELEQWHRYFLQTITYFLGITLHSITQAEQIECLKTEIAKIKEATIRNRIPLDSDKLS